MTAALLDRASTRLPANRQTRRPAGPKLRVLDQVASRRRARHRSALLILFVAVLAGFFAVAFVHAELVAGQHELDAVRADISQAEADHAELARAVEEASAPAQIVTRATELGMVRSRQPVYLTAAAPVRSIEVGPSLVSTATPPATGAEVDGSSIAQVAAGAGTDAAVAADGDRLRGTIGQAGGISAAVRIADRQETPAVALGTSASPVGASTSAASGGGEATVATTPPPAQSSGPVSSIAGSRAASGPAGAATSVPGTAPGSVAGTAAPPAASSAGGLASAAATTSG